jgi:hypothetical protein
MNSRSTRGARSNAASTTCPRRRNRHPIAAPSPRSLWVRSRPLLSRPFWSPAIAYSVVSALFDFSSRRAQSRAHFSRSSSSIAGETQLPSPWFPETLRAGNQRHQSPQTDLIEDLPSFPFIVRYIGKWRRRELHPRNGRLDRRPNPFPLQDLRQFSRCGDGQW